MTEQEKKEEKKLIVNEDWKTEAQKEKERLAAEADQKPKERHPCLPPASFSGLVSLLVTQALFALGLLIEEKDKDKKVEPNLVLAKFNIDTLATLEEKTKGNLTKEEQELLSGALHQLRMTYVQVAGG